MALRDPTPSVPIVANPALASKGVPADCDPQERRAPSSANPSADTRDLLEITPDAAVLIDPDWKFSFANQRAIDLLGVGSFVGENLWTLFPGNCEEPFQANYRRTMAERTPTTFEAFNGAPLNRWYRVQARPFLDGIVVFFSDVTDRREAEIARDRLSAQLQQVLDVTTDGILSLDRNYVVTFANRQAETVLASAGSLLGRTLEDVFPITLDETSDWAKAYRRAMEDRLPSTLEVFYPEPLNRWFGVEALPSEEGLTIFFREITAEREVTGFLREQQQALAFVQAAARVATLHFDLGTGEITWGHGSPIILGRPWAELPTIDRLTEVMDESSLPSLEAAMARCFAGTEVVVQDLQFRGADGSVCWVELRAVADRDYGHPVRIRGVLLDISARKADEQALLASESRYRVLSDLNPQALWSAEPSGRVTYANQGFLDYLSLSADELDDWLQRFAEQDREHVLTAWMHSVDSGEEYSVEARLLRGKDGAARWWHLRALPVRDAAGNILQWLGLASDIHDSRTAAERLHQEQIETERQRAELESVYENTPVGLGLFDPVAFRYLRVNDELARIIGLPKDEILGRTVQEVSGIPAMSELFQQVVRGEPVRNFILRNAELKGRSGELRSFNLNYTPVYDVDGRITGISSASLEITQQQRTEAALIQSEKLAAVGRLASSISHEINNPLEAVTNLLFLIASDPDVPAPTHEFVRFAQAELARVSQIATQTLRFHRQAVSPTAVTPAQLIDAVLNLYQGRLANSGIRVQAVYATAATVVCFENDIRQVLNNLIANSIDAMRSGGILLARAHDAVDVPTGRRGIRLSIADTGHGMDERTRQRVFEPFFTTKDLNGTGLGLWISAGIIERHHGRLTVRSSQHPVHHGTVFSLFLPHPPTDLSPGPERSGR